MENELQKNSPKIDPTNVQLQAQTDDGEWVPLDTFSVDVGNGPDKTVQVEYRKGRIVAISSVPREQAKKAKFDRVTNRQPPKKKHKKNKR